MPPGCSTAPAACSMARRLIVNPVNLAEPKAMRCGMSRSSDCRIVFVAPEWEERVRRNKCCVAGIDRPVTVLIADPMAMAVPGTDSTETPFPPSP